jgi:DNA polymerase V
MFALVDCNNFYASCERVFNAAIARRPVIVLSNNDGCVIARSNEAKALGFKMGDPYFQVRELAERHQVAVFSSNYTLYGDMSRRVMETLQGFAPEVEIYSIDEAFLNLAGIDESHLPALAGEIHQTVKLWTGIPVGVGVGRTKTLAKAANHIAKKDPAAAGTWIILGDEQRRENLARLPIGDVWGIGRRWSKFLEEHGIATALAFSQQPDRWIRTHLNVTGLRTAMELRGEPCIPLELAPPPKKCLVVSRAFGRKLTEYEPIQQALIAYVTRAGEKLRRERRLARHMGVFLQNSPFATGERHVSPSAGMQLPHATSDTAELIGSACRILRQLYRPGYHYSKCGVMLTELSSDAVRQGDLFDGRDTGKSRRLMETLDTINRRLGRDTVFFAGSGIDREWAMAANMKSPPYTTDWQKVLRVRA